MLKYLSCCGLLAICFFVLTAAQSIQSTQILGDGKWEVTNIDKCDDLGQFELEILVEKRRLNRSHEMFNADFNTNGCIIDDTYGVQIDVCKYVDGGCKPYQVFSDESLERFVKKYAESNMVTVFELAGLDPPDFPIPAGILSFKQFIFNYEELPIKGVFGEYSAHAFITKDLVKVACVKTSAKFTELENDK